LELNDLASAKVILGELEILKLAFKALGNRFAMGARHGGMLQAMLDRITVEFGGNVPSQTIEPYVRPVSFLSHHENELTEIGTQYEFWIVLEFTSGYSSGLSDERWCFPIQRNTG
jgi:hypothetical protein